MNIFKKQKDAPESQEQTKSMTEAHASSSAPDAAAVIGGLDWYRAQFRRAMKLALGLTVTLCASTGVVALLLLNQPKPQYFAATPDLRLAPMIPLDQPLLTQSGLLTWVSDTITGAMSLNFLEWREKLESIRPHFDDAAYKSFLASLQSSGVLDMIRDKRLSASAVATRAPVIIASGLVGGKATWKIEFP
ncbi:DotI/IcmL/TraM family protein [Bilophila sp.]|uniref:DotI/IcmL/TraM family protein n=1 Tax=Bilophila sp. TaxID=1929485 RepID=UPI0030785513